ncbi:hypothetical protein [Sphingosinicella sp. CPCC 101087]|uniref:hypothetical protein n=1 Tax=Sphingosinicella sp. CPCC 101087 TaxID=2497754 RepID=UPI00101CE3E0|nr:hypothetical protein [Sphingosinicella sp. CPCC 101087]
MTAVAAFVAAHWRAIAIAVPVVLLAALLWIRTDQRDDARLERDQARAEAALERAERKAFAEKVRATAEQLRGAAAATALRVERVQDQVTEEVSHAYQIRLAELRERVAALQLLERQSGADRAHPGRGADAMPGLPGAAGGPDDPAAAPGLPAFGLEAAAIATAQAIQLDELQRWIRRQQAIDRTPEPAPRE